MTDDSTPSAPSEPPAATRASRGMTRRRALGLGGGVLGLAAAGGAGFAGGRADAHGSGSSASDVVPFHGPHQAGIATPPQDRLVFGAFDLTVADASALRSLMIAWSAAAAEMTRGLPTGDVDGHPQVPPADTGEAVGLPASQLTITFGFGTTVFEQDGKDRMGLRAKMPAGLKPFGALPGDNLDPERSGGDLCVQACANDPQVAFHAIRNLARIARPTATLRWTQLGFGKTSSTSGQATPRNLMGFKDGTRNIKPEDTATMDRFVWIGADEPQRWARGGSFLVARRIRMLIEAWDRDYLADQEAVFGRAKGTGAPLTGHAEFDTPDLQARDATGSTTIPADAHIRLAAPETNGGRSILRRGYSYTDGIDQRTGLLDAGLFFVAFQQDPHAQFAAIQRRLGMSDALNEYIQHTGSGLFVVPPGTRPGGFVGETLFAS